MILFLIRLGLIGLATSLTALGIAEVSADGETITIWVGPAAQWLHDHATSAGAVSAAVWAGMWAWAKRQGGMT